MEVQSVGGRLITDRDLGEMSLQVEELESLEAQDDFGDFLSGVGIGLGIVGLVVTGLAIT